MQQVASTELTAQKIINAVKQIGFDVAERDNFYRMVGVGKYHFIGQSNILLNIQKRGRNHSKLSKINHQY